MKDEGGRMKKRATAPQFHPSSFILHPSIFSSSARAGIIRLLRVLDVHHLEFLAGLGVGAEHFHRLTARRNFLVDLPHVLAEARRHLEAVGIADRCELRAGDFFAAVPAGGDAYVLKRVLHDWDDARTIAILQHCHRAMLPQGRLVIIEMVIAPGNEPFFGKQLDVELLLTTPGGRERTEAEYRSLHSAAGFELTSITPTESLVSVIEGVRA